MNSDVKDSFPVSLVSVLTPMGTWQDDTILTFFVIFLKIFIGPFGSKCSARALWLWCDSLGALRHVGSEFSDQQPRTHVPCTARWVPSHWTTRQVPTSLFLKGKVFRVRQAWVQTPALVDLPLCISLGKLLYLSGLSFFISIIGIISTHL